MENFMSDLRQRFFIEDSPVRGEVVHLESVLQTILAQRDYPQAIQLSKQALLQAPDYTDISIFLGRLYTWSDKIDSARTIFTELDKKNTSDEDFFLAYASLEYWNDQTDKAIAITDKGLSLHPQSQDLLLLKGKISYGNDHYEAAEKAIHSLLAINPKNTEARALAKSIEEYTAKNAIGLTYNFVYFDKQFDHNWHIVGLCTRLQ